MYLLVHSSPGHNKPGLGLAKARTQNSILISYMGGKGPRTWGIFCCLSRHRNRELGWKQSGRDLIQCSNLVCWHHKQWLYLLCHMPTLRDDCCSGRSWRLVILNLSPIQAHRDCHLSLTS